MHYRPMILKLTSNTLWMLLFTTVLLTACGDPNAYKEPSKNPELVHETVQQLTDIIVYDIFSPPVASRVYAYPSIAAYEAMRADYPEYRSLAGQLTDLEEFPQPSPDKEYCFPLASLEAYTLVGKTLIFSEDQMIAYRERLHQKFKDMGIPSGVFENSLSYGKAIADHTLAWANKDNYKQTRTFPKFSVTDEEGRWQPTPPSYMEGIEPHWNQIRPFVIDSATQFIPVRPTPYNMAKNSDFYKEVMEVYEVKQGMTEEQEEIAKFWDCNPYVSHLRGHVMYATKKITPGGHWIGIVKLASRKAKADQMKSLYAYTATSIALADGFISCWDEKYRSNLIRPETLIKEHIDDEWEPLLQTPPFPEYTSGHSVISRAAAIALTSIFGDNFSFEDATEVNYGLPVRSFDSFLQASEEAAISRLYGGIHYRPAIDNGVAQGEKVGKYVVDNLEFIVPKTASKE